MMCRKNIFFWCNFALLSGLLLHANPLSASITVSPRVPDTLEGVYLQLEELTGKVDAICAEIRSRQDYADKKTDIEMFKEDLSRLIDKHPEINSVAELRELHRQCRKKLDEIEVRVQEYERALLADSFELVLHHWYDRFDSVLQVGEKLVEDKQGDSVKCLKSKVNDWWNDVEIMRAEHPDVFSGGTVCMKSYQAVKQRKAQINELSEHQRPKPGDVLMKVLVVVGVLTMIGGVVGSRIRGKKLQKKAEDNGPTFEI